LETEEQSEVAAKIHQSLIVGNTAGQLILYHLAKANVDLGQKITTQVSSEVISLVGHLSHVHYLVVDARVSLVRVGIYLILSEFGVIVGRVSIPHG
jgi:hypothetical protein